MSARAASCRNKRRGIVRRALLTAFLIGLVIFPLQAQKETFMFALTGDIMMGTTFPDSIHNTHLPPNDGQDLLKAALPLLQRADFTAGNLEGPFLERGGRPKPCKDSTLCYIFRTPPHYVKNLHQAGFDFVSLANNHINDFGPEGVRTTRQTLKEAGIACAGVKGVCTTTTLKRNGLTVGVAAFGHNAITPNLNHLETVRKTVRELHERCDLVVVSFHGGSEGAQARHVPHAPEQCFGEERGDVCAFARACVDAGADVVYGHGPHVVRAVELYKNRLIAYSLGNFCTPYRISLSGRSGYAPVLTVTTTRDGRFVEGRIHSFVQYRGKGPQPDSTHRAAREVATLTQEDFPQTPLTLSADGRIRRK